MRRLSRLLAVVGLLAALQVALASPASAHAVLLETAPSQNSAVESAPERVTLRFNEPVEVALGAIQVLDAAGDRVDRGNVEHPGGQGDVIEIQLQPGLEPGGYAVGYRVVSADGHPIVGAFTFGVGSGTGEEASALADEILAGEGGDTTVGAVFGVVRWLGFTGLALLVGGAAFVLGVWRAGRGHPRVRVLLWAAWGATFAATLAAISMQGLASSGLPLGSALDPELLGAVADTRFGLVHLARAGLLLLAIPAVMMLSRPEPDRAGSSGADGGSGDGANNASDDKDAKVAQGWLGSYAEDAMLLLALALLLTVALGGHAATGLLVPLALITDVVHLAAVSGWLGGLVLLTVAVLSRRDAAELRAVVPRFSAVATWLVAAVVLSGLVQAWRQVGTVDGLFSTTYGRLLLTKVLGVAFLVGMGYLSRQVVNRKLRAPALVARPAGPGTQLADPAPEDAEAVSRLRRSVGVEVVIAALVLALTSLLVNAIPARSATTNFGTVAPGAPSGGEFGATIEAGDSTVVVTASPARTGRNELHFSILDANSQLAEVPEFAATLNLESQGLGPIELELEELGPGHYAAYDTLIPIGGTWELTVTVRSSEIDQDEGTAEMLIRN